MGVVRLLCITILFACLVAAQDCSGNGHKNLNGDCICNSGFSDLACATPSTCPAAAAASAIKADRHPVLDTTVDVITFTGNYLKMSIVSELVPNRTFTNIAFVPQPSTATIDAQCNLNGAANVPSLWSQYAQVDANGHCRDEFQFNMFWGLWSNCGFLEQQTSADYWVYKARFIIYYTDDVGAPYTYDVVDPTTKPELFRKSSVSYTVYVRFLKTITLYNHLDISVNNTVDYKLAITRFDYDPSSMSLTFGISTMVLWPARMNRTSMYMITDPAHPVTAYNITNDGMPTDEADNVAGEVMYCMVNSGNCLQYFEWTVQLLSGCNFDGTYIVGGTVDTCRDRTLDCTQGSQSAQIDILTSDVCGTVTAEPTVDGYLMSFDVNRNVQTEFLLGTRGYFEVQMESQKNNNFNLTWIDIWVVADVDTVGYDINDVTIPSIAWLFKGGVTQTDGFYDLSQPSRPAFPDFNSGANPEPTGPCDLQFLNGPSVQDLTIDGSQSQEVIYTPHFNFRFDSRIFPIPLNAGGAGYIRKGYTLHARGHIVYAGNERYERTEETVDFVWSTDASGLDSKVRFGLESGSAAQVTSTSNTNTALAASLAPVAGIALVVVAAAVVAAVIIKRRKATSTFATLN